MVRADQITYLAADRQHSAVRVLALQHLVDDAPLTLLLDTNQMQAAHEACSTGNPARGRNRRIKTPGRPPVPGSCCSRWQRDPVRALKFT